MNAIKTTLFAASAAIVMAAPAVQAKTLNFTAATYNKFIKSGKPFMLGVHTSWCSTCATQRRVINSLRNNNPEYKSLTVLEMDWDKYRGSKLGRQLRIPRRSTLIMYSGGKEVGRIIAGTSTSQIKRLIDKGV